MSNKNRCVRFSFHMQTKIAIFISIFKSNSSIKKSIVIIILKWKKWNWSKLQFDKNIHFFPRSFRRTVNGHLFGLNVCGSVSEMRRWWVFSWLLFIVFWQQSRDNQIHIDQNHTFIRIHDDCTHFNVLKVIKSGFVFLPLVLCVCAICEIEWWVAFVCKSLVVWY